MNPQVLLTLNSVLNEISKSGVNDTTMEALRTIFNDGMLLAALDLVDNKCVFRCDTSWNRTFYWVQSTADPSAAIHVNFLGEQSTIPWSCECPTFVKHTLLDNKILMCKHILAAILAVRTNSATEKQITECDLLELLEGRVPA